MHWILTALRHTVSHIIHFGYLFISSLILILFNSVIKVYWVTHSFIPSPRGGSEIKNNQGELAIAIAVWVGDSIGRVGQYCRITTSNFFMSTTVKCRELHKSIRKTQPKFYCKFYGNEHVLIEKVTIQLQYCSRSGKSLSKRKWLRLFKPSSILKFITEILKALF